MCITEDKVYNGQSQKNSRHLQTDLGQENGQTGKKESGIAFCAACNKDGPLYVFIVMAACQALIKMQKGCETLRQLVNHEKSTLVNSLWEHNFIQSCLQIIYLLFSNGKYSQSLQHQLMVDFQTSCTSAMESLCSFSKVHHQILVTFHWLAVIRVCHGQL
jgi:hypothetical protein